MNRNAPALGVLSVAVFASVFISFSVSAFAAPVFSLNNTLPYNGSYNAQGWSIYNKTIGNVSFQVNVTDLNVSGTPASGLLSGIESTVFQLGRPNGQLVNFTFNASNSSQLPSGILFGNVSSTGSWNQFFINFTQDQLGGAGTYNYTWYAFNYTTRAANTTSMGFFTINKTAAATVPILLNGTTGGSLIAEKGSVVNITATTNETDGTSTSSMTIFTNFTGSNASVSSTSGSFVLYNSTNTSQLTLANYTVFANISATENYTAESNNTNIFVILEDTTPPVISNFLISPTSNNGAGTIKITASVFDIDSNANTFQITYPNGVKNSFGGGSTAPSLSFTDTGQSGTYTVKLTSNDNTGNTASTSGTFVINLVASSSSGGGGGSSGGTATTASAATPSGYESKNINIGTAGATVTMDNSASHGIVSVSMDVLNSANNVMISVQKLPGKPSDVTQDVNGVVFSYVSINESGTDKSNVKDGKIDFKVDKSWISANNIDPNTIKLNRYGNSAWSQLSTSLVTSDSNTYTFEALTPGFSTFAVTGQQLVAPGQPSTQTTPGQPSVAAPQAPQPAYGIGADAMYMIAGVIVVVAIAAGLVVRSKGKKGRK